MPLNLKVFKDFASLVEGKFRKEVVGIDPTIKASMSRGITVSTAAAAVSLQEGIVDAVNQSYPQTSDDDFLELTGEYNDTPRFLPQISNGSASVGGTLSTLVPDNTAIIFNGNNYLTILDSNVLTYSGALTLTFSAGLVTAVTTLEHTLASGLIVTITDAVQTDYNGTFEVIVLDSNTFTYELVAGVLGADVGNYTSDYALLNIESQNTGSDKNIGAGGVLIIDILNINDNAFVGAGGVVGGADLENIDDYRERVMSANSLTPGISTPPSLKFSAKSIEGNTRVFVIRPKKDTTGGTPGEAGYLPQPGETVVYVLRDNDPSIIPSSAKLTETKDKIIADGQWPTFLDEVFLYVLAPILVAEDFSFSSITPNTVSMQNAIDDQLVSFFQDNATAEGGTISLLETLNPFLRTIQDPSTGQLLTAFTYTSPPSDIITTSGEVAVKGSVSFA